MVRWSQEVETSVSNEYCGISNNISGDDDDMYNMFTRKIRWMLFSIPDIIQYNVKDHKDPGSINLRIIHDCSQPPFKP